MPSSDVRPESMLIGKRDRGRLTQYIAAWEAKLSRDAEHLAKVRARLRSCVELPEERVPPTRVTIGSQVCIRDVDTGKSFVWSVVLPPRRRGGTHGPLPAVLVRRHVGRGARRRRDPIGVPCRAALSPH